MKEYKATDPEMVQAQKDLAKMSNLSDRVITNDKDLFEELSTIQRKLCEMGCGTRYQCGSLLRSCRR